MACGWVPTYAYTHTRAALVFNVYFQDFCQVLRWAFNRNTIMQHLGKLFVRKSKPISRYSKTALIIETAIAPISAFAIIVSLSDGRSINRIPREHSILTPSNGFVEFVSGGENLLSIRLASLGPTPGIFSLSAFAEGDVRICMYLADYHPKRK